VIDSLEDADDYAEFEMAVTADFDAQTAVERELVLRLASLLWRLRRATSIETGLFRVAANDLSLSRSPRQSDQCGLENNGIGHNVTDIQDDGHVIQPPPGSQIELTRSFLRLDDLATYPLDRLNRYEAALWRQACQILFTLQYSTRRKAWQRLSRP
jgi:hypothetical protein